MAILLCAFLFIRGGCSNMGQTTISIDDIGGFVDRVKGDVTSIALSVVRNEAKKILHDILDHEFYAGRSTQYYSRTGEMADAVDIKDVSSSSRQISFTVYIDTSRLSMVTGSEGRLGAHMGVNGEDFRAGLPIALDQGSSSPIYSHPAHNFMEQAHGEMTGKLIQLLASGLTARGYNCYIG